MVLVESVSVSKRKFNYGEMRSNAEVIKDDLIKKRVIRGMELLQERYGEEWVDHISPENLDLGDGGSCILGQVYGGYNDGLGKLRIRNGSIYGFDSDNSGINYEDLNKAWKKVFSK